VKILLTGGTGFIGSHTCIELLNAKHDVIIVDNLCNSNRSVLEEIEKITGKTTKFYQADLMNEKAITDIFIENKIEAVIHFAGLKSVNESVQNPMLYYQNNLIGTMNLLKIMTQHNVKKIIFSSSACVYGIPKEVPISENSPLCPINPYGQTKAMIEQILQDISTADKDWNVTILRYFNPVGAHESGLIGENPNGTPNNLVPIILRVISKQQEKLSIFGNDYDTPDGTAIRDYIHVCDLAHGHLLALEHIKNGVSIYNLGTGRGYSVLEILHEFDKLCGYEIPRTFVPRRPGDAAVCYANVNLAKQTLNFVATHSFPQMCADAYNYLIKKRRNND
jgi:UDP-glucose 4-epimerase